MVDRRPTRRQVVGALGSAAIFGSGTAVASGDDRTDAVLDLERDATYPRCLYKRSDDGEWYPALPINVHVRAAESESALERVVRSFSGLDGLEWTSFLPDATARAWDDDQRDLVPPDRSVRRLRFGDEWNHVHCWDVDDERVAIHAHLDVLDLSASHFHRGDYYGEAAREVADLLTADGWQERRPHHIEYGVDDERLERWGETGDLLLVDD
ncbi:hypothetical protein [Halopiger goleimassiliensis]|uniref:hypothetical protein n=1 Tax=Halopiger goleimassiliensis TaxID=1293048 RepID=UPI000677C402|nr:hypothetical protein [Halopiger goleimassiliensis]